MKMKVLTTMFVALLAVCLITFAGCDMLDGFVDIDGADYETAQLKSESEVEAALGDNYEITVRYGSVSSDSTTEDGNSEWMTMSTTKVAGGYTYTRIVDLSDETITPEHHLVGNGLLYTYDETAGQYLSATSTEGAYYGGYSYVMSYVGDSIDYNTVEDATILNRNCKKYTRNTSVSIMGTSAGMNYVYYIDEVTGLCLKFEMSGGVSSTTEGSTSGSMSYVVTDLKLTGADLTSEIAKIAVVEWPTETNFTEFGLTNVTEPAATYRGGSVEYASEAISELSINLRFVDATTAAALCSALYVAGANLDSDGATAEESELLTADNSFISFTASTSTDYSVRVTGYSNGDSFDLSISFSK